MPYGFFTVDTPRNEVTYESNMKWNEIEWNEVTYEMKINQTYEYNVKCELVKLSKKE